MDEQPLQNILSLSTAGRNRYLLHFNSHHALTQWTAAIRLAMYEHATLQEAYTGALIAGKGKTLNNINVVMERMRVKSEAWVRVRFGAGVPWRRCWCVITPPDEKEYQKLQKEMKKRSPYDRSHVPVLKGNIKFFENKKESAKKKKAKPIATIADAQAAYAIYPQAKALIDASTLLKIEGTITIHSDPPSSTEGFVFIMPEASPAVSGFEMLLRYLFPTWDTFGLYGRPGRLVASTLDARSLMFAMPKGKRYGYMDVTDVAGLIASEGSDSWSEREWRKRMKELTGQRMNEYEESGHSRSGSHRSSSRLSYGNGPNGNAPPKPRIGFANDGAFAPLDTRYAQDQRPLENGGPPPGGHGMPGQAHFSPNPQGAHYYPNGANMPSVTGHVLQGEHMGGAQYRMGGGHETPMMDDRDLAGMRQMQTPEPVSQPPAFNHGDQYDHNGRAYHTAEMRRATVRLSQSTLSHIAKGGGVPVPTDGPPPGAFRGNGPPNGQYSQPVPVVPSTRLVGASANDNGSRKVLNPPGPFPSEHAVPLRSHSPANRSLSRTTRDGPIPGGLSRSSTESRSTTSESRPPRPGQDPLAAPPSPHAGSYSPRAPSGRSVSPSSLSQRSVPRHGPQGRSGLQNEVLPPLDTSPRNPVPGQGPPDQRQDGVSPQTASSVDSFSGHIDRAILDRIRANETDDTSFPDFYRQDSMSSTSSGHYTHTRQYNQHVPSRGRGSRGPSGYRGVEHGAPQPGARGNVYRQGSAKSSHHSLADSTLTPDYASTHKSTDTAASAERPRAGVLRTVGGADSPARSLTSDFSIPDVNFGPTINYSKQPKAKVASPPPMQTSRRSPAIEQGHSRQDSNDTITPRRRSIMWQPAHPVGGASSGSSGGQSVSVEEYVQQRAAAASAPVLSHSRGSSNALGGARSTTPTPSMGHARSPSGNTLGPGRSTTPTPTMARTISDDMLTKRHSRGSSTDLLQRPNSRGANSILDAASSQRASSQLSARELEQVAKMTGSPLISMAGSGPPAQSPGLVGAIQAREKEKLQVKAGYSSQTMQNAISQRERQMHQKQMQQQQAYQHQQQQQAMHHPNMSQGQVRYPPQQQRLWQGQPQGYGYGQMGSGYRQPPMGAGYRPGPTGLGHPAQGQPRSGGVRSPPLRGPAPGVPHGQYRHPQGGQGPMYQGNAF